MTYRLARQLLEITSIYFLVFLCFFTSPIHAANLPANTPEFERLLTLIDQRLQLMRDVAAYKYANHIAIENKPREKVVLASAVASARKHQLDPATLDPFFRLQIELAKIIQKGWIENWQVEGLVSTKKDIVTDLKTEIRPKLIALGTQLVEQLPLALPELNGAESFDQYLKTVDTAITTRFVTSEMKRELFQSLLQIRKLSPRDNNVLANILNSGVLRVGTTGDYPPFSYIDDGSEKYSGIDIDLARNLAGSLGVELQLISTSWPDLMADLAADKYDVGMSGISRTLLRQRTAFFSKAYSTGGKTPIVHCDAVAELNSLHKIDRSAVRVIVNPGGTNEKFVRKHINNAQLIVYPDNTRIFNQIIDKHADVMITDAIEVKLQQQLHPELCAAMPGELFTHAEKGYLMPQDIALKEYVDAWLRELIQTGVIDSTFSSYLE
ncbi:MAG: gamma subclass chorismate mutase AroQ [Candidatus Reddybacter sp.]